MHPHVLKLTGDFKKKGERRKKSAKNRKSVPEESIGSLIICESRTQLLFPARAKKCYYGISKKLKMNE